MSEDNSQFQVQLTTEEPKKKRAKILSACGECRRKKTKCDGEQPCHNCQKSKSKCIYSNHLVQEKRHASKATLEAIENRLKIIESMLKTILDHNNISSITLDHFLSNQEHTNRLPSIQNLSASIDPSSSSPTTSPILNEPQPLLPSPLSLVNKNDFEIYHYQQHPPPQSTQRQYKSQSQINQDFKPMMYNNISNEIEVNPLQINPYQPIKKRKR